MKPTHKERADFDSDGNRICEDCLAHVRPGFFQMHDCPPWLRMLVRGKKAIANQSPAIRQAQQQATRKSEGVVNSLINGRK